MIKLSGTYTGPETFEDEYEYVCRVFFVREGHYANGVGTPIKVSDEDILKVCGQGTWFALYRRRNPGIRPPDDLTPEQRRIVESLK